MFTNLFHDKISYEDLFDSIEGMYEGFLLSSIEGRIFYANQAVIRISGLEFDEIIGKTPNEMEEEGTILEQSTLVSPGYPITMIQKLRTGREVFITSVPVYNGQDEVICFIANYRDLSYLNFLYQHHIKSKSEKTKVMERKGLKTDNWIGNSRSTIELKEKVARVAKTNANILIMGESGVGKEVVARNLHKFSDRKDGPFIPINCGALPKELIEAELFGYEKGAFTGAVTEKIGLIEAANNGTVLLDEIGEMPQGLQVRLLRVIQTKKITRVGGTKERSLDVRFIAATNRNLKELIKQGSFREDLYYRLNVIPIFIPPLRERREDILQLSQYFLKKTNDKYKMEKVFSPETLHILQEFNWPGNIRQLENIVERLVIMAEGDIITPTQLPEEFAKGKLSPEALEIVTLEEAQKKTETRLIRRAVQKFGSIRKAAKPLGVSHSTLVRKIKRYNITLD